MPAMPSSLLDAVWAQFAALLPPRPVFDPSHPLGCHRRRIPDRVVFEHIVAALVHGSGDERIATPGCSAATIRRRRKQWARLGLGQALHAAVLAAYDKIIGLELEHIPVDGCIAKAPGGGPLAGPSPVDRRKQGIKRSIAGDATGIPLGMVITAAQRHDAPLLEDTLRDAQHQTGRWPQHVTVHLDAAYDWPKWEQLLQRMGLHHQISWQTVHEPVSHTRRWPIERTHSWMNSYGKIRRSTDRDPHVIAFYHYLAAAFITCRALIRHARQTHRWPGRPTTRRLP